MSTDNSAGLGGFSANCGLRFPGPPSSRFSTQSVQNTHTHIHTHSLCVNTFWPGLPPGRQKYVGGGDGRWRLDCATVTRSPLGAQAWFLHFSVTHQNSEYTSPEPEAG